MNSFILHCKQYMNSYYKWSRMLNEFIHSTRWQIKICIRTEPSTTVCALPLHHRVTLQPLFFYNLYTVCNITFSWVRKMTSQNKLTEIKSVPYNKPQKLSNHRHIADHFPWYSHGFYHFYSTSTFSFYLWFTPKKWRRHTFLFHIPPRVQITPPRVQITFYLPPPPPDHCLCTSPTYWVALAPFHQKKMLPAIFMLLSHLTFSF